MTMMKSKNIGILGMEIYFPPYYLEQTDLEEHDQVSTGKYTIGLGQKQMAFCSTAEDAVSMCLNAFTRLLARYNLNSEEIGRLEVGSESNPDRAKSIKSHLMEVLRERGSSGDVAGSDCIGACYGGTSAFLNAVAWMESSQWDGESYAVVVAGDVAVYPPGPARPTGGCGAIAILIGPDAPLLVDQRAFGHHSAHHFDFYKPDPRSEHPLVNGPLSVQAYLEAAVNAFQAYKRKFNQTVHDGLTNGRIIDEESDLATWHRIESIDDFDHVLFHSPYSKIVFKAFNALLRDSRNFEDFSEEEIITAVKEEFSRKTEPSLQVSKSLGNLYCGSVYCNLLGLLTGRGIEELLDKPRIGIFSYGSGSMSTFYSLRLADNQETVREWLQALQTNLALPKRLAARLLRSPQFYESVMMSRQEVYGKAGWKADSEFVADLLPGTFYLAEIDEEFRRHYRQK